MALPNLYGEPDRHALSYNLQVPLPPKLLLELADLLLSIDALLES